MAVANCPSPWFVQATLTGENFPAHMKHIADTIPGSRLVRLPGTGRLVPEEAPETIASMILEFVGAAGMVRSE